MNTPPPLNKDSIIGIIAPAGKVEQDYVEESILFLENEGFRIERGSNLYNRHNQFAGTDEERLSDLQYMLDNPEIEAILCARGGYGCARIVDKIDFTNFIHQPKWVIGYSDITALHNTLFRKTGIETMHAIMPKNFSKNPEAMDSWRRLVQALKGEPLSYQGYNHYLNSVGKAKGKLIGGNLSVLFSMRGTPLDLKYGNKILFIEDLNEYLYHHDRMLNNLRTGGIFSSIKGLIAGQFTDMKDSPTPFGKDAWEIIVSYTKKYNIPVIVDFPAGHTNRNFPLIIGRDVLIEVNDKEWRVEF